jgi:phenylalanine-4-hydroxylase
MLTQDYNSYTETDQQTWAILYQRQVKAVQQYAYANFWNALRLLDFDGGHIPRFDMLNKRLTTITGWGIYAVPGLIDNAYFFEQLEKRKFGATTWLRKPEQLDYLEEPDMFHDVFGHVPLLADAQVCRYLSGLAVLAWRCNFQEDVVEAIARLYWYTIEFGLVREKSALKIYGAGILSSTGETQYCMSGKVKLVPFDVETIIATPYMKDSYQAQYFVLDAMGDLPKAITLLEQIYQPNQVY